MQLYVCRVLIFLIAIAAPSRLLGQDDEHRANMPTIALQVHYGSVFAHSRSVSHLAQSHPWGIQADIMPQINGKKEWHHLYNFPKTGLSLLYLDFQNPDVLGHAYAAIPFFEPSIWRSKLHDLTLRVGSGLVYLDQIFDIHSNHTNNALGNAWSFALQGTLGYQYRLSSQLCLHAGLNLIHFSNGAYKVPNAGINVPSISSGIVYGIDHAASKTNFYTSPPPKHFQVHVSAAFSVKEVAPTGGPKYPVYTVMAYVSKRLNRRSAFNIGIDGIYNTSLKRELHFNDTNMIKVDLRRVATTVGHELYIGRLSFLAQVGVYVYKPQPLSPFVYQRYGLKYYVNRHIFAGISLRAHFGSADVVEWTLGASF